MNAYTTVGDGIVNLKLTAPPQQSIGSDQILVKMLAVSLNYRDLLVINGVATWKPQSRRIPVSDGVGVVLNVGKDVSEWKAGDIVAGIYLPEWLDGPLTEEKYVNPLGGAAADGVLSEQVVFHRNAVVKVPDHLSPVEAATLPVAAVTAWHAVSCRSQVAQGESVLIQGTGGVSLFAIQFVSALGGIPILISSSDEKIEKAKRLGVASAVNYKKYPDWEDKVLEITNGKGVDHVIEVVGGANLNRSLKAIKTSGTISFIGLIAGLSAPINTYHFVTKNVQIHGIESGSKQMFMDMNKFVGQEKIRPVVDRIFSYNEIGDALRYLESGAHFGKVVVQF
ncbi:zinc-dependent alcohol dehydrogenase family protein [Halomonas campaniensis]|jgi:NADPH:quinone reductase-like Zn-dependent oxidoreductase|uniref:Enoyl reductase (ER) domain-containing protein n=1 Tax=Halomonas campaniensis TaxID=213554 RepID=A0A246S005_9GAMM|nr:NAD(P)-dependent alcohol dehydrogenase [Halomonas campaniensis]OWV29738.1 hypothetical protein JI62_10825 [Halomonas campaniensis]